REVVARADPAGVDACVGPALEHEAGERCRVGADRRLCGLRALVERPPRLLARTVAVAGEQPCLQRADRPPPAPRRRAGVALAVALGREPEPTPGRRRLAQHQVREPRPVGGGGDACQRPLALSVIVRKRAEPLLVPARLALCELPPCCHARSVCPERRRTCAASSGIVGCCCPPSAGAFSEVEQRRSALRTCRKRSSNPSPVLRSRTTSPPPHGAPRRGQASRSSTRTRIPSGRSRRRPRAAARSTPRSPSWPTAGRRRRPSGRSATR